MRVGFLRPEFDQLALLSSREAGVAAVLLRSPANVREVCRARRNFLQRSFRAGYSLTEIAGYLGLSISATCRARGNGKQVKKGKAWHRKKTEAVPLIAFLDLLNLSV